MSKKRLSNGDNSAILSLVKDICEGAYVISQIFCGKGSFRRGTTNQYKGVM